MEQLNNEIFCNNLVKSLVNNLNKICPIKTMKFMPNMLKING